MTSPALPSNRDENWRYANLRPLAKARPEAVSAAAPPAALALPPVLPGYERWVFIDGHVVPALSAPPGPVVSLLDFRDAGQELARVLDFDLAQAGADFSLARINLQREGKVLHVTVPDGGEARLELNFVAAAAASAGTSYPRVQIHAGRGARLRLVERHLAAGAADPAINAAFDLALASDATIDHCRLQNCADAASVFDTLTAHVGERATYRLRTVTLGGLTSRSTLFVKLAGRAARCELVAASIANGIQTHDIFAQVDHVGPATTTRELFRGIATERGKLAFNGKMIVRESAHDADSDQSLKTLLNGSGAEAAARPQLEIYTDKVRARHGATTGKLDEQMLFYLLSRGIDRPQAQALLQWAFIEDAVSQVELAPLRQEIEQLIAAQLNEVSALDGLVART
ncbi:MAG TPA: SufD family Fe-S cluster assembly protein [Steroidobacteraceae bacterium]|jgi:Fe-S cluster assembly protein SufD|nr:SufD family Fe-S cluster assembly protein [Steroidobacteraceae bacterium]